MKIRQKPQISQLWGEISEIALAQPKVLTTETFKSLACLVWAVKGMGLKRGLAFTNRRKSVATFPSKLRIDCNNLVKLGADLTSEAASSPIPIQRFFLTGYFDDNESFIRRNLPHQTLVRKFHHLLTKYPFEFVYLERV